MNQNLKDAALSSGVVKSKIVQVLHTATILRAGWEMDNEGWVVKLANNKVVALTTNHGDVCLWTTKEMIKDWKHIQDSADEVNACLQLTQGKK